MACEEAPVRGGTVAQVEGDGMPVVNKPFLKNSVVYTTVGPSLH